MRLIFLILFLLISTISFGQVNGIKKGTGIAYTDGVPTFVPRINFDSEIVINMGTGKIYRWDRPTSKWMMLAEGIDVGNFLGVPTYIPVYIQSRFVINLDEEVYFWTGTGWVCLNCFGPGGSNVFAKNGLTMDSDTVLLGGYLDRNTEIDGLSLYNMRLDSLTSFYMHVRSAGGSAYNTMSASPTTSGGFNITSVTSATPLINSNINLRASNVSQLISRDSFYNAYYRFEPDSIIIGQGLIGDYVINDKQIVIANDSIHFRNIDYTVEDYPVLVISPDGAIFKDSSITGVGGIAQVIDTFDLVSDTIRLSLSDDNEPYKYIVLPSGFVDTDQQTLSIDSTIVGNIERFTISISNGNSVSFDIDTSGAGIGLDTSGYNQDFYITNDTLYITDGDSTLYVDLTPYLGGTDTSGYNLSFNITNDTLFLEDGNNLFFVDLNPYLDNTDTSGYNQSFTFLNDTLTIVDGNSSLFVDLGNINTDTSGYNQVFQISNDSLFITDGDTTLVVSLADYLDNTDTSGYNQVFQISNDTLYITDGDTTLYVDLSTYLDNTDTSGYNLSFNISNDTLYVQDGNSVLFVDLSNYLDNTDTSGYNLDFYRSNDTLYITDGNSTLFTTVQLNTDDQILTLSNDTLYIEDGNFVLLTPYLDNTDTSGYNIDFYVSNDTLYIQDGNSILNVDLSNYLDNTDTSGYNLTFDILNDTLYLTDGNSTLLVDLTTYLDNTDTSGYNISFTRSNDTLYITDGNSTLFTTIPTYTDDQTLILSNDTLYIEGGNFVLLDPYLDNTDTSGYNQTFVLSNDTLYITDGGTTLFVDLSTYLDNTDTSGYNLSFSITNDTLYIEDGNSTLFVDLVPYINTDTDNQYPDTFTIESNILRLSLVDDALPFFSVDLSPYLDNTDTSGYNQIFQITNDTLYLTDGDTTLFVDLTDYINTDNQTLTIDSFTDGAIKNFVLTISNGNSVSYSVPSNFGSSQGQNNVGVNLGNGIGVYAGKVDTSLTFKSLIEGYGIDLTATDTTIIIKVDTNQIATVYDVNYVFDSLNSHITLDLDINNTNEIQLIDTFTLQGNELRLSLTLDGEPYKFVDLSSYLDNTDTSGYNLSFVYLNDTLTITDGDTSLYVVIPTVTNTDDQIADTFQIVSNVLRLSLENDGLPFYSVDLSPYLDNTDTSGYNINMVVTNDTLFLTDGNSTLSADLSAYLDNTDTSGYNQTFILQNDTLFITDGSSTLFVELDPYINTDTSGYNLSFSIVNDTLFIQDGDSTMYASLEAYLDNTDTSGYNISFTRSNDTLYIVDGNSSLFAVLPAATVNTDDQNLTLSNDTLYIEDGNFVLFDAYRDSLVTQIIGDSLMVTMSSPGSDTIIITSANQQGLSIELTPLGETTNVVFENTSELNAVDLTNAARIEVTHYPGIGVTLQGSGNLLIEETGPTGADVITISTLDSLILDSIPIVQGGDTIGYNYNLTIFDGNNVTFQTYNGSAFEPDSNGIYTGSNTVPSQVVATLTDKITWYSSLDDFGGFAPVEIVVNNGNEPDFLKFMYNTNPDSLVFGISDQDFVIRASDKLGFFMPSVSMFVDSFLIQGVPNATNIDTFVLVTSSGGWVRKVNLSGITGGINTDDQTIDTFEIQSNNLLISLEGDNEPALSVSLSPYLDNTDTSGYNQSFYRVADTLYIQDGLATLTVTLPSGLVDTDDQTLSLSNDTLYISEGNSVYLGGYLDNTDTSGYNLNLTVSNDTIFLTDGNGTLFAKLPASTDAQTLAIDSVDLTTKERFLVSISNGNTVAFDVDYNTDAQTLSLSNDTLTLSNGNFVVLPEGSVDTLNVFDPLTGSEMWATVSGGGDTLKIKSGTGIDINEGPSGEVIISNTGDLSSTNELQTIDTFRVQNDSLIISLSLDSQPYKAVDLSSYIDGNGIYSGSGIVPDSMYANIGSNMASARNELWAFGYFPQFNSSLSNNGIGLMHKTDGYMYLINSDTANNRFTQLFQDGNEIQMHAQSDSGTAYHESISDIFEVSNSLVVSAGLKYYSITMDKDAGIELYTDGGPLKVGIFTNYGSSGQVLGSDGTGNVTWVSPANFDNQIVDTFRIINDTLQLSLIDDGQPYKFVDLIPYDQHHLLSTGVLTGGVLSVGTGGPGVATTFSITDGVGVIVDNTVYPSLYRTVTWSGLTNVSVTNIGTQLITFVAIDTNGAVVQSSSRFTSEQSRQLIEIGVVVHSNQTTVNAVNQGQIVAYNIGNQLSDLILAIGIFNVDGNVFSANGANKKLSKTDGSLFRQGANYTNGTNNPHIVSTPALNPVSLRMQNVTGAGSASTTDVDTDNYDVAGVTTPIPTAKYVTHRIFLFQSNLVAVQRGQEFYNSMADAVDAISTEAYVTNSALAENGLLRGYLTIRQGATDLSDPTEATFVTAAKFSGNSVVGASSDNQVIDTFAIVSDTLRISLENDGQPFKLVNLLPYLDNTDAQNLTIEGVGPTYDIAISGGSDVTIAGGGIVTLSETPANTLLITATEVDGSTTNEIQDLSFTGVGPYLLDISGSANDVYFKEGTGITMSIDGDSLIINSTASGVDTSGYNQTFTISNDTLYLTDDNSTLFVNLDPYIDNTDTQTLVIDSLIVGDLERFSIAISNGDTVYFDVAIGTGGSPFEANLAYIENYENDSIDLDANVGIVKNINGGNISFDIPSRLSNFKVYKNGIELNRSGTVTTRDYSLDTINNIIIFNTVLDSSDRIVVQGITGSILDLYTTSEFTGDGTVGNPLTLAQQSANTGQVLKWNGSTWSPANDSLGVDNDNQTVDTFQIVSNVLRLSLEDDAEPFVSVDLSSYLDNTDNQALSIDSTTGGGIEIFYMTISNGNTVTFEVPQGGALVDGDYGDIDVTSSGTVWTIDTSVVTWNNLTQAVKDSINLGGSGDIINGGQSGPITIGTNDATVLNLEQGGTNVVTIGTDKTTSFVIEDAITNNTTYPLNVYHNSTGTPITNFGTGLLFYGESSTTPDRLMGGISTTWSTATDGTRTSNINLIGVASGTQRTAATFRSTSATNTQFTMPGYLWDSQGLTADFDFDITTSTQSINFISAENITALATNFTVNASTSLGTGSAPHASAVVDVVSTTKGFGLPSMTTAQRNAIGTPRDGLTVYDSDLDKIYLRANGAWEEVGGGSAQTLSFSNDTLTISSGNSVRLDSLSSTLLVAAPSTDHTASGTKIILTANEDQNFGDIVFINADGEGQLGDADTITTAYCVAMVLQTVTANNPAIYLTNGVARDDTWNWTVGQPIYLSTTGTTGNTLTQTAPSGTNDVVQVIGIATHADRILFNPQLILIELN